MDFQPGKHDLTRLRLSEVGTESVAQARDTRHNRQDPGDLYRPHCEAHDRPRANGASVDISIIPQHTNGTSYHETGFRVAPDSAEKMRAADERVSYRRGKSRRSP